MNDAQGQMVLHEFGWDARSTISADIAANDRQRGYEYIGPSEIEVHPINALRVRNAIQAPISLLSVDIEGHELAALRSIDLAKWQPMYICLEVVTADGGRNADAITCLSEHGYVELLNVGFNIVFERRTPADSPAVASAVAA